GTAVPVHPDAVRDLIADPRVAVTLRRLVTDPVTGHLLDAGRRAYQAPAALRAFIAARDGTCRFPGCARRADTCQVDHAVAWDDGGRTDLANLGALCTRHHQLKTHAGWDVLASRPDGSCSWRSPGGRPYEHAARPVLPAESPPPPMPATPARDPDPPPF
ncbi:MAG: HNH endonuclease signature motif containing protein, partial [Actinomycetes bacterium]